MTLLNNLIYRIDTMLLLSLAAILVAQFCLPAHASVFFATGTNNLTGVAISSSCVNGSGEFLSGESLWTESSRTEDWLFEQTIEYVFAGASATFATANSTMNVTVRETGNSSLSVSTSMDKNMTTEIIDSQEKITRSLLHANGSLLEDSVRDVRIVTQRVFNGTMLLSSTIVSATPNVSTNVCN